MKTQENDINALTPICKEILVQHNLIRQNPRLYKPKLKKILESFRNNIMELEEEKPIETYEGVNGIKEAIQFLENQDPVNELIYSEEMSLACLEHLNYLNESGLLTHEESDGSDVSDRIKRHCVWDGICAENIDVGFKKAENIIISLLIDDGNEYKFQRENLFNERFKYIGIAFGDHKVYGTCTVLAYAEEIKKVDDNKNESLFISKYLSRTMNKPLIKNEYQKEDPFAPDDAVSLKIKSFIKNDGKNAIKVTKRIYTLSNGSEYTIETEDI